MGRGTIIAGFVVALLAAGCTSVQKGTAAGAAVGTGVGAGVGHLASAVGAGPGAIVGLGLGAAGGAMAADYYYDDEDTAELEAAAAEIQRLEQAAADRDAKLAGMQTALAKEQAQQKALLQAYEKARMQGDVPGTGAVQPAELGPEVHVATLSANVLFDSGKAALRSGGKEALRRVAADIRAKSSDVTIEVKGHTDNQPIRYSSYKSNYELSCARAQAVVEYLVSACKFDRAQFVVAGCGATEPVASNNTAGGRQKNRRAEIIAHAKVMQVADGGDS
jgi:flagellar motor protein MotB